MDMQQIGEIRYDYLQVANEAVRDGVSRAKAVDRYQDAAYTFHVRNNVLNRAVNTGHLIDVAA